MLRAEWAALIMLTPEVSFPLSKAPLLSQTDYVRPVFLITISLLTRRPVIAKVQSQIVVSA